MTDSASRLRLLLRLTLAAAAILACRILFSIVREYPHYFPPDFESAFLTGRRATFGGLYAVAFYTHICVGPIVIVGAMLQVLSGTRAALRNTHRLIGRFLMVLVLALLVPSGFAMAPYSLAGVPAAVGFAALSLATAGTAIAAVYQIRKRKVESHQRFALRCFVLLCSPLLLRLVGGLMLTLNYESTLSYQLNAWLSWLVPLICLEVVFWHGRTKEVQATGRE